MSLSVRFMRRVGLVFAAVALVAAIPAMAGSATSNQGSRPGSVTTIHAKAAAYSISGNRKATPDGAYDNCVSSVYCSFNATSGGDECLEGGLVNPNPYNWPSACRNHDESFANRVGGAVRLWYSPNKEGAWACVNNGWYSNNLNQDVYTFNNGGSGDAGYGQEIWENVASSAGAGLNGGPCSNPLPEDG